MEQALFLSGEGHQRFQNKSIGLFDWLILNWTFVQRYFANFKSVPRNKELLEFCGKFFEFEKILLFKLFVLQPSNKILFWFH